MSRPRPFATLSSRLVLTAVALVVLVSVLIGVATTLAMRSYLTQQLDDGVRAAQDRAAHELGRDGDDDDERGPRAPGAPPGGEGQEVGTLVALVTSAGTAGARLEESSSGLSWTQLDGDAVATLARVPDDGQVHSVRVPGAGGYRVVSSRGVVAGLPTTPVDAAVTRLLWLLAGLTALGVAGATGLGLLVVRRQLAPLREVAGTADRVAQLPLASGEIELAERVPGRLTDHATEVGQVGAALNALLDHVESSLEARHRSEQQVRQFVADASHELRTPLATIAGYAELARRRPDDADGARLALGKVDAESARMTALVEDLLLLARLDAGRPLAAEPVDLTRLLLEAVADARVLAPDHTWRLDLPEEVVEVVGDEHRLHQVVANLLTNARKYTPPGTTVTVTARPGRLVVHDDGPGFAPDVAARAFERFVRGDAARTRSVDGVDSGAGLGLSLVQAIVTAHGGRVELTSRPGDTAVTVTLPVR